MTDLYNACSIVQPPVNHQNVMTIPTTGSGEHNMNHQGPHPERGGYMRRPLDQVTCYKVTLIYSHFLVFFCVGGGEEEGGELLQGVNLRLCRQVFWKTLDKMFVVDMELGKCQNLC